VSVIVGSAPPEQVVQALRVQRAVGRKSAQWKPHWPSRCWNPIRRPVRRPPITGWRESRRRVTIEGVLIILTPPLREYRRPGPVVFRGGPPPRYEPPRQPEPPRRRRRIPRYLPGQARFTRISQRVRRPLRRRGWRRTGCRRARRGWWEPADRNLKVLVTSVW